VRYRKKHGVKSAAPLSPCKLDMPNLKDLAYLIYSGLMVLRILPRVFYGEARNLPDLVFNARRSAQQQIDCIS